MRRNSLSMMLGFTTAAIGCNPGPNDPPIDEQPAQCRSDASPPNMVVVPLVAGRIDELVGEVDVWLDGTELHVRYATQAGWDLLQTHVAVGETLAGIPTNPAGCPRIELFPWAAEFSEPVDEHDVVVDLAAAGLDGADQLVIAAHARVQSGADDRAGAWADGVDFPTCPSIAEYITVDLRALRGLLLWNKLDSADAVANSEYGPDGTVVGDVSFVPAKYGNGFRPEPRLDKNTPNNYIKFEGLDLGPRGSLEFWYWPNWQNSSVGHVVDILSYGVPGDPYNQHITEHFNDWQNRLAFNVTDAGAAEGVSASQLAPFPGWTTAEPFHVVLNWDACAPDPADRVEVFINGEIAFTERYVYGDPSFDDWLDDAELWLGSRMLTGDWYRHNWEGLDGVMDNVKIWNHPKTDLSDRFSE